ncbi:hypothetical protein ACN26Y_03085 [Micromonospora sp. WMMD558]|uniref:hypothetical protein n=1 Tax=Micromonospora sp. WMMD558 TaxID=3403462 RepID=UPI003BF5FA23
MTSPAEPASTDPTPASQLTRPLREPAAFVLLGANAVFLFVGLIRLLTPTGYGTFTGRAGSAFFAFAGIEAVVLPLLAVLLATHLRPVLPRAKLITQVAVGEYAVSTALGGLTFLIWSFGRLAEGEVTDAFLGVLARLAGLALLVTAGYAVYRIWRTLYYVPKPKPQPGVYGKPQSGWPGGHPGHPGGHPGQPGQPGQPNHPGQPGQPGWPGTGQSGGWTAPTQYGAPYGQPAPPFPAAPHPAPPANPAPHPAPPAGPPFGQPPSADPTQAIPRQPAEPPAPPHDESHRTQRINPADE